MSNREHPPEPTSDQCNESARLPDFAGCPAYACWYPQMGGYCGKCVVMVEPTTTHGCFAVFVWHDGSFPFGDESPAYLHHCSPDQFSHFGHYVRQFQDKHHPPAPLPGQKPTDVPATASPELPADQFDTLAPGLYVIHWKGGGHSLAAVGQLHDGANWVAPCNWSGVGIGPVFNTGSPYWDMMKSVQRIAAAYE